MHIRLTLSKDIHPTQEKRSALLVDTMYTPSVDSNPRLTHAHPLNAGSVTLAPQKNADGPLSNGGFQNESLWVESEVVWCTSTSLKIRPEDPSITYWITREACQYKVNPTRLIVCCRYSLDRLWWVLTWTEGQINWLQRGHTVDFSQLSTPWVALFLVSTITLSRVFMQALPLIVRNALLISISSSKINLFLAVRVRI